jgi:hypothetical protein
MKHWGMSSFHIDWTRRLALALVFFMMPSLIAVLRRRSGIGRFVLCNFLFGWTSIGWLILIWRAFCRPRYRRSSWQNVQVHESLPATPRSPPTGVAYIPPAVGSRTARPP